MLRNMLIITPVASVCLLHATSNTHLPFAAAAHPSHWAIAKKPHRDYDCAEISALASTLVTSAWVISSPPSAELSTAFSVSVAAETALGCSGGCGRGLRRRCRSRRSAAWKTWRSVLIWSSCEMGTLSPSLAASKNSPPLHLACIWQSPVSPSVHESTCRSQRIPTWNPVHADKSCVIAPHRAPRISKQRWSSLLQEKLLL